MERPRYGDAESAAAWLGERVAEYAIIPNTVGGFQRQELLALGPKHEHVHGAPAAIFLDMDGTISTTEDLCLNALEAAMDAVCGNRAAWGGLHPARDFPHIIGHATSQNIAYLFRLHGRALDPASLLKGFLNAIEKMARATDGPFERRDASDAVNAVLGGDAAAHPEVSAWFRGAPAPEWKRLREWGASGRLRARPEAARRAALAIYQATLYGHLARIAAGDEAEVAASVFGDRTARPIRPLPGVALTLALAKGWLGEEAGALHGAFRAAWRRAAPEGAAPVPARVDAAALSRLGACFETLAPSCALVTSSGGHEAGVVLPTVFEGLAAEADSWPIGAGRRARIREGFSAPEACFDAIITADACHEGRLKPHRDLYAAALNALKVPDEAIPRCIGFEDSEAGVLALRAAGVGVVCATPFHGTRGHAFDAASHVLTGGMAEAALVHGMFLGALA